MWFLSVRQRFGGALEEVERGGRARVLVTCGAFTQVAGPSLSRDERNRRVHPLLGGRDRRAEGTVEIRYLLECPDRGQERVQHRLVARLCLATRLDALHTLTPRCGIRREVDLGLPGQRRAHLQKQGPVQR